MPDRNRLAQVPNPQSLREIPLAIVLNDFGDAEISKIHGSDSAAFSYLRKVGRLQDRTCHE